MTTNGQARPRRILIVPHQFPPQVSGIGNVAAAEAERLAAAGNDVTVLTTGQPYGEHRDPGGYRLVRCPSWDVLDRRRGIPFPFIGRAMLRRTRELVSWSDVVHIHDVLYLPCWAAAAHAQRAGRPMIVTQHVATIAHPSAVTRAAQRVVYGGPGRAILRRADRVIVVNDRVGTFVRDLGVAAGRVRLIPNGVDAERFRPAEPGEREKIRAAYGLPQDAVLALFVGRIVPKKGADRLLRALHEDYVVVLAGGDRPDTVADDGRTVFLGTLSPDQVAEVYRASDIFVLPSESEGFPLSAQEAMASGLPVVLRDDPGYAPYELDESTGVRFVGGEPDEIRCVLRELAADADRRCAMGESARAHAVKEFGWALHAERLDEVWNGVLAERR